MDIGHFVASIIIGLIGYGWAKNDVACGIGYTCFVITYFTLVNH